MKNELKEVEALIREVEVYEHYKLQLVNAVKKINSDYQAGRFGYVEYENHLKDLLKGKAKDEWVRYYNSYIYSLLKRMEYFFSKSFYAVYEDRPAEHVEQAELKATSHEPQATSHKPPATSQIGFEEEVAALKERLEAPLKRVEVEKEAAAKPSLKTPYVPTVEELKIPAVEIKKPLETALQVKEKARVISFKESARKPSFKFAVFHLPKISIPRIAFPKLNFEKPFSAFKIDKLSSLKPKQRSIFMEEIIELEKAAAPAEAPITKGVGVTFTALPGRKLISDIMARFRARQEPVIGERIEIPVHVRKIREMRKKIYESERLAGFDATLLAQEAKRIRRILEVEKPEVYKGSSIGLIANVTVKRVSLYLVDTFPEIFGYLYNALRAANVKILSNTYVNIMILCTLLMSAFTSVFMLFVFFLLNHPLYEVFLRSVLFGIFAGVLCATFFYVYPFLKIKERRRNITTNLPFAINHVASVSASGVPPAKMFELISTSIEYGEVAVEIMKIVDFVNVFGYDLLTAVRSVASTTPNPAFKEFLEGLVSVIETGGDLSSYLRQKADEATLNYELERRKYNETVSTYSDIYTGVVIAAPLLFMSTLSMVNLLGGTLGGLGVDVVMALGAYLVIPLLNIGFLVFLQMNQPEI